MAQSIRKNDMGSQQLAAFGLLADPAFHAQQAGIFDGAMRYKNTDADILRFPFPFKEDAYGNRLGIEAHDRRGDTAAFHSYFDIDSHYKAMVAARHRTLLQDPTRYQSLPHMMPAQWEAMVFIMENLAFDHPQHFTLIREGQNLRWQNRLLQIDHVFTYGDETSLPDEPFAYIGRQMQGDMILLNPRDGSLFMDVALVSEAFYWSVDFIFGLDWRAIHGPVQHQPERAAIEAGRMIALRLRPDQPMRRVNWGTQTRPRLDMSMENRVAGFGDQMRSLPDDFVLRTEFQQLYRLPQTGTVLFCLRNYMASLRDIARVRHWAIRLHRVLRDFSPDLERFASLAYRQEAVAFLAPFDDGRALPRGRAPGQTGLDR